RGNVITFANGSMDLLDVLPPAPEGIKDTISVIFVGSVLPSPEELDRVTPLLVRRHVVVPLLTWLKANSSQYKDVRISQENMDSLLPGKDAGVPCGLQIQLVRASGTENATASTVPVDDPEDVDIGNIPVTSTGVISKSLEGMSVREMKLLSMLNWKRAGGSSWAIPHGRTPIREWHNPDLFPRAFPALFPWGVGGLEDPTRVVPLTMDRHVPHLLK
ncbi:hypothetical protein EXIGLDRAFT_574036, partial [Exidia glandulosa HHB12029]